MFKNLRRSYWLLSTFAKKHFLRIVLTSLATATILIATPQLAKYMPTGKPHLRIGRVGQYSVSQLPSDIQNLISSGLTAIAEDGSATPSLALNWQVSQDGKRYVFKLDPGKTWQDNQPFQAADINYTLADIDYNLLDSQTIEFQLKEPFAPFPTVVSTPLFRQTKSLSRIFKSNQSTLIGTGKYQVTKVKKHGQYIDFITLESAKERVTYKFYTTETAAVLGFKLGEVDIIDNLSNDHGLANWQGVKVAQVTHPDRYVAVFFNTQDPNLSDKNLRQALTYAIPDKSQGKKRALGPIHPSSWAYNPQVKEYATNLERARELLDELKQDDQQLDISIRLDTSLAYLDLAEKIKTAWENLGIATEVRVINFPANDYQALLAVHQIPPDPDQYTLWHSTQSTNLTQLKSPKIDKLLEDGRKTFDKEKRKEIYHDFQRFLLEESPAAFLFYQTTYTISRN